MLKEQFLKINSQQIITQIEGLINHGIALDMRASFFLLKIIK
jgi:hypothetical protein